MTSSPAAELLPTTRRALLHHVATAQAEGRAPTLVAAVVRDGEVVWSGGHGDGADTGARYRIGSITKTFTAVLVLRLREEGLLSLDDPLDKHLPGTGVGDVTVAQLLSHTAGLAAETPAPWWERTPGRARLADALGESPRLRSPGRRFHYSNPGYALLGSLVEAVRGVPWEEALRREVLEPLGMERTGAQPAEPYARGWAVHPWADVLLPEPAHDQEVMAPAGQLWSTVADLGRLAALLMDGDEHVLSRAAVEEMRRPAAPPEAGEPDSGYGLGLQVLRRDGRDLVGHGGSLPGFLAGLWTCPAEGVGAVVLANVTSGPSPSAVATDLVRIVAEAEPRVPAPWRPLSAAEPEVLELTGPWYWGAAPYALRLTAEGGPVLGPLSEAGRGSRFTARPDGTWTGLDGYWAGETLRAVRRPDGTLSHLDLGSFAFTRAPYGPSDAVPGGVDETGWRGRPGD